METDPIFITIWILNKPPSSYSISQGYFNLNDMISSPSYILTKTGHFFHNEPAY